MCRVFSRLVLFCVWLSRRRTGDSLPSSPFLVIRPSTIKSDQMSVVLSSQFREAGAFSIKEDRRQDVIRKVVKPNDVRFPDECDLSYSL